jgi:predicted aminopeptidase
MLVVCLCLSGCQALSYYGHAVAGQIRLLHARQPVAEVMAELHERAADASGSLAAPDRLLLARLTFTDEILDFAETTLTLPVGRRYRSYVDLERPYVVWNVFAAPPLSLEAHRWCYPLVGCAPYRGFFDPERAQHQAWVLQSAGLETYVGGVAAYSTLGWFADPLLSSFIFRPEPQLAELLFHELAHTMVWVRGDVAFNESFATFVGSQGVADWYASRPGGAPVGYVDRQDDWRRLQGLLGELRAALQMLYDSTLSDAGKAAEKRRLFAATRACYADQRGSLGGGRYDALLEALNNAVLASLATYQDLVPAFREIFERHHGDWAAFFAAVRALAAMPSQERDGVLGRVPAVGDDSAYQQITEGGDDGRADEVQCEALASHGLHSEASGAVDDDIGRSSHGKHERA